MLQVFVIDSHALWQILGMQQSERRMVRVVYLLYPLNIHLPQGTLYLYVKTIERAHSPAHMWERIKLSNSYSKALEQVLSSHCVPIPTA